MGLQYLRPHRPADRRQLPARREARAAGLLRGAYAADQLRPRPGRQRLLQGSRRRHARAGQYRGPLRAHARRSDGEARVHGGGDAHPPGGRRTAARAAAFRRGGARAGVSLARAAPRCTLVRAAVHLAAALAISRRARAGARRHRRDAGRPGAGRTADARPRRRSGLPRRLDQRAPGRGCAGRLMMVEQRRIDAGGHRLAVATAGVGPPHFVCLHGLADTLAIWDAVTAPLAARGQVVLVGQRAHGTSDAPPGPYRREHLAADVRAVCDQLGIARAVLIGHSMGGVVAMATALAYPDRIAALVLLGTASECSRRVAEWYETIAQAAERDGLPGLARAIYGAASRRTLHGDAGGMAHVTRCLKSLAEEPLTPRLAALACPTLLLVGENDPMGAGASVIIQRAIPTAALEVIPGRGHWLHVEAPDALIGALDRFLVANPGNERKRTK